jgi:hypothetical protein
MHRRDLIKIGDFTFAEGQLVSPVLDKGVPVLPRFLKYFLY